MTNVTQVALTSITADQSAERRHTQVQEKSREGRGEKEERRDRQDDTEW